MMAIGCALPPYNSFSRLYKLWNRVMVFDSWGPYFYQADDLVQSLKPTFNNILGYDRALKDTNDYYVETTTYIVSFSKVPICLGSPSYESSLSISFLISIFNNAL